MFDSIFLLKDCPIFFWVSLCPTKMINDTVMWMLWVLWVGSFWKVDLAQPSGRTAQAAKSGLVLHLVTFCARIWTEITRLRRSGWTSIAMPLAIKHWEITENHGKPWKTWTVMNNLGNQWQQLSNTDDFSASYIDYQRQFTHVWVWMSSGSAGAFDAGYHYLETIDYIDLYRCLMMFEFWH